MIEDEARDAELAEHTLRQGGFDFSFKRVDTEDGFLRENRISGPMSFFPTMACRRLTVFPRLLLPSKSARTFLSFL